MICAGHTSLAKLGIDRNTANLIRNLCALADSPDKLAALIDAKHPQTAAYARQCYNSPWDSPMWRRTMVLHAVDVLLGTCGVEALGEGEGPSYAPPYEYCNTGDSYALTLVYKRSSDRLFVGSWGDIAERNPSL